MPEPVLRKRSLRQLAFAAGVVRIEPGFEDDAAEVASAFGHTAIRAAVGILERRGKGRLLTADIVRQALQTVRGSALKLPTHARPTLDDYDLQ